MSKSRPRAQAPAKPELALAIRTPAEAGAGGDRPPRRGARPGGGGQELALVAAAAGPPGGGAIVAVTKEAPQKQEARFCELVPMIHDWLQRSFAPLQEERLQRKGRLCARFQVNLGRQMADHLQAYIRASFALKLLQVRVRVVESTGRRPAQEVVEVIMTQEARALYAEKNPEAVQKHQQQMVTVPSEGGGLVDADEGDDDAPQAAAEPLALEAGQLALENGPPALTDGAARAAAGTIAGAAVPATPEPCGGASAPGARARAGGGAAEMTPSAVAQKRHGKRKACAEGAERATKEAAEAAEAGGRGEKKARAPAKEAAGERAAAECGPPAAPPPAARLPSGTGSIWEQVEAHEILPGATGVVEAKEALADNLERRRLGGLEAMRAEKEAVAWLKGLMARQLDPMDLKETKIGLAVNEWRKHLEPYVARLATALLSEWKRSWREAEKVDKRAAA